MQASLPHLPKFRSIVHTPDGLNKRIDESQLKNKIIELQKQIDQANQNKSFVMKIQNQQCTLCPRLKLQIDELIKQEKVIRKQYELRIEELLNKRIPLIKKENNAVQTQQPLQKQFNDQETQTINFEEKINSYQNKQFQEQNNKQQNLNEYEQIIIDFHKEIQTLTLSTQQYKQQYLDIKKQYEQLKMQQTECEKNNLQLTYEIKLIKSQTESYKLPDDILFLKKSIDCTLEQNMINSISMKTQDNEKVIKLASTLASIETELYVSLRCFKCKEFFNRPQTFIPCGHTVCQNCLNNQQQCEKCDRRTIYIFKDNFIEQLLRIYKQIKSFSRK